MGERLREDDDFDLVDGCGDKRLEPCTWIEVCAGIVWGTACCLLPLNGS